MEVKIRDTQFGRDMPIEVSANRDVYRIGSDWYVELVPGKTYVLFAPVRDRSAHR